MDFIIAVRWLIDLVKTLSTWWNTLAEPLFTIGDFEFSFLGIFSISLLVVIFGFKIADLVIPV